MKPRVVVATPLVCTRGFAPGFRCFRGGGVSAAPVYCGKLKLRAGAEGFRREGCLGIFERLRPRAIADGNMQAALTRRQALIGAAAGLLAVRWPSLVGAQAAAGALTLTDLGPDLVLAS